MKALITLCFVISWTVICGTVLAQIEVENEKDKNQADLEELIKLLEKEEFLRSNIKGIDTHLGDVADAEEEKKNKCDDPTTICDAVTTEKCVPVGDDKYFCKCKENYKPESGEENENTKKCIKKNKCDDPKVVCDAASTEKCVPVGEDKYYCKCKDNYKPESGKETDNIKACIAMNICEKKEHTCSEESTKCFVAGDSFYCACLPNFVLPEGITKREDNKEKCTSGCDLNFCKNFKDCEPQGKGYKCNCLPFFTGKNCTDASCAGNPCKNGGKCEITGKDAARKASCSCKAPFTGNTCEENSWCNKKICGDSTDVECKFSETFGTGYCKCNNETQRFNYVTQKCEDKPECLYKKCPENKVCDPASKECICKKGYELDEETKTCKSQLCVETCFKGSQCSEVGDGNDAIKCSCNSTQYYITNECKDASCLLPSLRSNCEKNCPNNMERQTDGQCKPIKKDGEKTEVLSCTRNCKKFGYCNKEEGNEKEKCECIDEAVEDSNGECVLRKELVCPDGVELTKDKLKCNCTGEKTGSFKDSSNGITCDRKSCSDKDVQEKCRNLKAACEDNWKNGGSYQCVCRNGYVPDTSSKICIDQTSILEKKADCSKDKKMAFLKENGNIDCMCPPGLAADNNGLCLGKYKDKSTYLIHNVPILKAKYVHNSAVDVVSLTKDVIDAMTQTFKNLDFARLYKYNLKDDILSCSIWLQFKDISEFDYNRIPLAAFEDGLLLPGLQLKREKIDEVKGDELYLCSGQEHDPFCGGTECKGGTCKCPKGYKVVDASIITYNVGTEKIRFFNCEDVDECSVGSHSCPEDTTACVNTEGSFYCRCLPKYKLKNVKSDNQNKEGCIDACADPNPCKHGKCKLHASEMVDCSCDVGFSGSFCDTQDVALAGANKKTVIVGAVLGTILGVLVIAAVVYIARQKKNSYSEDFAPAPRGMDNAEMVERRPMRGVTNRAYQ